MGTDNEQVEDRLSVFDDEPDINDWVEIFSGAFLAMLGMYFLMNPGDVVRVDVMQWFSAAMISVGAIWAGHGLKDMAVKEIRHSIVVLDSAHHDSGIDLGLIRDVLVNPAEYQSFLLQAYEEAYEDGIITEKEMAELSALQEALGLSDDEAAKIAARAAINLALKDGSVGENELKIIMDAAKAAKVSKKNCEKIMAALEDGKLDEEEEKMLSELLSSM
jgi:tellurite resistance protein